MADDGAMATGSSPSQILLEATTSYIIPQILFAAASLGIADELADGPRDVETLAGRLGAHPVALARLMRALCSVGIFAEVEGSFGLTALGACLAREAPGSVRGSVLAAGAEQYRAWAELLHSVRTGEPAFDKVFGQSCYDYLAQHPDSNAHFAASMVETGEGLWQPIVAAYDCSLARTVVDVGGGRGALLAAILVANPALRGILFDMPSVVAEAGALLQAAGVADRCTMAGGSFFDGVPAGGDVYVLARTLLNWEESKALAILRRCREVMAPGARLLLVEPVLPEANVSLADAFNDLNLLVLGGGQMCTEAQLRMLFDMTGFRLTRIVPTTTRLSLIEGVPDER